MFPHDLAGAVDLDDLVGVLAGDQGVAIGKAMTRVWPLEVRFPDRLAVAVVLDHLVELPLGHDDMALLGDVAAAPLDAPVADVEALDFLARGVEEDRVPAVAEQDDLAILQLLGAHDV